MGKPRRAGVGLGVLVTWVVFLLGSVASSLSGAEANGWCEPPEALRQRLEAIDPRGSDCRPDQSCWQSAIEAARQLRATYPDDLFVNRTYQDLMRVAAPGGPDAMSALVGEYVERARTRLKDPVAQYLAARVTENAEAARKLYEAALAIAPDFPWSHLGLAVGEARKRNPASRDQALIKREVERVMTLCPSEVSAVLQLAGAIDDTAFWQGHLAGLRAAVGGASPREQLRAYPMLWRLEFRLTPLDQHPRLRQQVAAEVKAIEALRRVDDPMWWSACSQGLDLTGDTEAKERLAAKLAEKRPCSDTAVRALMERWRGDFPPLGENAGEAERAARAKAYYDATSEWVARCPEQFDFWLGRLFAIEARKDLPNDAVRADLDRILEVWERNKNRIKMAESPYVGVARVFLDRSLELERVPSLVQNEIDLCRKANEDLKTFPEEKQRRRMLVGNSLHLARLQVLAGRAELALGRRQRARAELDTAAATLDAARADTGDIPILGPELQRADADLLEQRAGLTAAEGHAADAAAMLLKAATLSPKNTELTEKARAFWQQAGGTADGWAVLTATRAASKAPGPIVVAEPSGWEKGTTVLKPFDLQALDGKHWTLDDLKGRVALVNVWATWCGPCREELPEVQKLHERLAGRRDVALLTLDVDMDVGLVAPFLAEKRYSFPVLLASAYVKDLWKDSISIPKTWILDRAGAVRYEQMGFNAKARDTWADDALRLIDELSGEKAPATGVEAPRRQ